MDKYIIASFIGGIGAGTRFEESKWPLHVTLVRTIHTEQHRQRLIDMLTLTVEGVRPFILVGKSEELFGPSNDRPVVELNLTVEAVALNNALKKAFAPLIDSSFPDMFPTYRPHVTRQGDEGIAVGDNILIDSASLVLVKDTSRLVLFTAWFGS